MTASAIPPTRISGRASDHVCGRRKRVASTSSSSASVNPTIATAAITLAAISVVA